MSAVQTSPQPEKVRRSGFEMPLPTMGQIVLFYRDCNPNDPNPAIVFRVMPEVLELGVFVKDSYNVEPMPHVRHKDDPKLQKSVELQEGGCWDFTEADKSLKAELLRLALLASNQVETAPKK